MFFVNIAVSLFLLWLVLQVVEAVAGAVKGSAKQARKLAILEKNQARLAKAQEREREERVAEDAKLAAQIAKHEEQIMKLEQRIASAENEIAFNREQRDRLFSLLDIAERERDAAIEGSSTWQKHQRKVISLENQIHTVQKRIDKAHADKALCEKRLEVA